MPRWKCPDDSRKSRRIEIKTHASHGGTIPPIPRGAAMRDSPTRTGDGAPVSQKDATLVFETSSGAGPLILRLTSDRYELRDEIARGGMGIILAARDTALNREVVVKVLREE